MRSWCWSPVAGRSTRAGTATPTTTWSWPGPRREGGLRSPPGDLGEHDAGRVPGQRRGVGPAPDAPAERLAPRRRTGQGADPGVIDPYHHGVPRAEDGGGTERPQHE